jgi:hypothetical protein
MHEPQNQMSSYLQDTTLVMDGRLSGPSSVKVFQNGGEGISVGAGRYGDESAELAAYPCGRMSPLGLGSPVDACAANVEYVSAL